jgi:hypothetical protein
MGTAMAVGMAATVVAPMTARVASADAARIRSRGGDFMIVLPSNRLGDFSF